MKNVVNVTTPAARHGLHRRHLASVATMYGSDARLGILMLTNWPFPLLDAVSVAERAVADATRAGHAGLRALALEE